MESLPALAERREKKMRKKRIRRGMSNSAIAGVDLGGSDSLATVLSPGGEVADRFSFPMSEEGYALFSGRVSKDARVAFEATLMAYPFARKLRELGYTDITVAHPTELAWIVRSKKKNDRADSLKIAKLHLAGLLPESHLLGREEQIERDLLIQRVKLGVGDRQDEEQRPELPHEGRSHPVAPGDERQLLRREEARDPVAEVRRRQGRRAQDHDRPARVHGGPVRAPRGEDKEEREGQQVREVDHVESRAWTTTSPRSTHPTSETPTASRRSTTWRATSASSRSARTAPTCRRRGRMSKDGPSIARWTLGVMVDTVKRRNPGIKRVLRQRQEEEGEGGLRPRAHDEEARQDDPPHARHRTELEMGGRRADGGEALQTRQRGRR